MNFQENYDHIRGGGNGIYEQKRGLIAVWGKEAVQFLNGLITNDVAKLEEGEQMLAAFPNAKGRLLAVVRVLRHGEKFLFDTEEATHEAVFNNLFRFTFAGDFFVEDLSGQYRYFEIFGEEPGVIGLEPEKQIVFTASNRSGNFIAADIADNFKEDLTASGMVDISDELYETLRIESGVPHYGVDMDDTTIVPELGIDGLVSYNKGCYIGQEIIARIHFRGHVAKQLTGLTLSEPVPVGTELTSVEGKPAGKITSVTFSPKLGKTIALAYIRYDYLAADTELKAEESFAVVKSLPLV